MRGQRSRKPIGFRLWVVHDVISIKIDEILNDKIQKYLANIDNKINSIIKEVMTQKVTDALNDILTK